VRVLAIRHATVDRLLQSERHKIHKSIFTTRPGSIFKHQIKITTFTDWDNVVPGLMEVDLVAHCGVNTSGTFINRLALVAISATWLKCIPLISKSACDVIEGQTLPALYSHFHFLGLIRTTFMNLLIMIFSVLRRLIGYVRFEGLEAREALTQLYKVMRLYVNFFQPPMKLSTKARSSAKVTIKYG